MSTAGTALRVVIAEDAAIMRDGLTQTLTRRGLDVVAAVADAEALRQAVEEHRPDVAIVDVRMPPTHTDEGLRAARAIHEQWPGSAVLVFSQYIETQAAAELFAGRPAGSATCSRTGWPTSASSSTRSPGWRRAGRCSIPRWSASCSAPAAAGTPWPR